MIINDLLDLFWEAVVDYSPDMISSPKSFKGKILLLLSENYREIFKYSVENDQQRLGIDYYRYQLLTDYICGMTDSFAQRLHSELFNG